VRELLTPAAPVTRIELGDGKSHLHSLYAQIVAEDGCPGDQPLAYDRALQLQAALAATLAETGIAWLWQPLVVGHGHMFAVWCCMRGQR
jgi:hypothetical protein